MTASGCRSAAVRLPRRAACSPLEPTSTSVAPTRVTVVGSRTGMVPHIVGDQLGAARAHRLLRAARKAGHPGSNGTQHAQLFSRNTRTGQLTRAVGPLTELSLCDQIRVPSKGGRPRGTLVAAGHLDDAIGRYRPPHPGRRRLTPPRTKRTKPLSRRPSSSLFVSCVLRQPLPPHPPPPSGAHCLRPRQEAAPASVSVWCGSRAERGVLAALGRGVGVGQTVWQARPGLGGGGPASLGRSAGARLPVGGQLCGVAHWFWVWVTRLRRLRWLRVARRS